MRHAVLKKPQSSLTLIYYFIKSRLGEAIGLGLVAIGFIITASLLTYDTSDPSWNVAIDGPVRNIMGADGAIIADMLYQTFGSLSYLCGLTIGTWGCYLFAGRYLRYFWLRVLTLPFIVISLSVAGQFMLIPFRPGFLGRIISHKIASLLNITKISTFMQVIAGSISITLSIVIMISAGITWADIRGGVQIFDRLKHILDIILLRTRSKNSSEHPYSINTDNRQPSVSFHKLIAFKQQLKEFAEKFSRSTTRQPRLYQEPNLHAQTNNFSSQLNTNFGADIDVNFNQAQLTNNRSEHVADNTDDVVDDQDYQALDFDIERSEEVVDDVLVTHVQSMTNKSSAPAQSKLQAIMPKPAVKMPVLNLTAENIYQLPPHELLNQMSPSAENLDENDKQLQNNARQLMSVLEEFGVKGQIIKVRPGPVVTLYELVPAAGVKTSRVVGLADDIARSMCALSARIAVVMGHNALGIELPNKNRQMVFLRELITDTYFNNPSIKLALALGKDISGNPVITDLARMPHLLVAGTTGSGKSVAINTMILSLLYCLSPDRCRFIMIDPKMLELSVYDGIPHLLTPVVTDPKKAIHALKWTVREMEDRYRAMSCLGVRNIEGYNARLNEAVQRGEVLTRQIQTGFDPATGQAVYETQPLNMDALPYIVVVVDEMADLMMVAGKEIEAAVQRLAQMARAAGIHLIMATQRPSVDVITGTIKANFPTRISFQVTSRFDSRTILGEQGAEQLLGRGDMLYMEAGGKIQRIHGPFVSDREVEQVVQFLKQQKKPDYIDTITDDIVDTPLTTFKSEGTSDKVDQAHQQRYQQAVELIKREGKASTSFIQRHLRINYNNAARVIEQMEAEGLISAANHVGKREVYIHGK